jgi:hypothetical protein
VSLWLWSKAEAQAWGDGARPRLRHLLPCRHTVALVNNDRLGANISEEFPEDSLEF